MDFFEDAFSKTREVIETVSQKTGEVITVEKQKFEVASLRAKRNKDYRALGRIYFEAIKDDENLTGSAKTLVERIKQKDAEIERLNAEIQNARNKRVCEKCGANIDKNSVFCNICGARVDESDE
ncbi:MAG: zinc-ribbon domain-containing protein [Clostridia bacterium]|nr:zinc-ribbon domain-containing protein [Clostridia bacterium]